MNIIRILTCACMAALIAGCQPYTKKAYLEKYDKFMNEVKQSYKEFGEKEWQRYDRKNEQYADVWYEKFKGDMTLSEKTKVLQYKTQYKYYRYISGLSTSWKKFMENDLEEMKTQLRFFIENDMEEGIHNLWEKATREGEKAMQKMKELFKELNLDWKHYMDDDEDAPDQV